MKYAIKHRGPDDDGIYINKNIGLGHVRLSIIDLTKAGHQPMFSWNKKIVLISNGEIYNFIELKEELKESYKFETKTDTEVIIAAYLKWGKNCLEKFNGDFSFVLYNIDDNEIFGARDRFGIKPFYYYHDNDIFIFASEIKAILTQIKTRNPNDKSVFEYLILNRTDQTEETFYENILKLGHGKCFTIKNSKIKIEKWYDLKNRILITKESNFDEYRDALTSSIRLRLRSDIPIGVCLSGGIDSSSIVSIIINNFNKNDIDTFSAVYGENELADERKYIDEYSKVLKNMHYTYPNSNTLYDDFQKFIFAQSEPVASIGPYAQYKVMELAKKYVGVTLDGQGADEMLAGYHYFFGSYFKELLKKKNLIKLIVEIFYYIKNHNELLAFKYFLLYSIPLNGKKYFNRKYYGNINEEFYKRININSEIYQNLYNPTNLNDSLLDHFEYKLEHLLKWEDHNSMNFSIESRVPFLDHNLVEKTLSLPTDKIIKKGTTKYILRESLKDILPKKIRLRNDKKGFSTPSDKWFREKQFQKLIIDIIHSNSFKERGYLNIKECEKKYTKHIKGEIDISKDIWKWINLDVWFKEFIEK